MQDPSYPVYVDTNVIAGRTGGIDHKTGRKEGLVYMDCTSENGFIPKVPWGERGMVAGEHRIVDLIYLCSPNNPTGAVIPKERLEEFVDFASKYHAAIIFDAAYSWFISDPKLPRSIYEIKGAKEVAVEINSFSKMTEFTGVRLGWTVAPKEMKTEDSGRLNDIWNRRQTTFFNGASNIVQEGGLAALSEKGLQESAKLVGYYMENARIIREGLQSKGLQVYGGDNAPYIWMANPGGMPSWKFFDKMLNEAHVVTTPGVGFGPAGGGYTRLSSFGHRKDIRAGVKSIKDNLRI